jgi:hypothetical protein
LLHLKSRDTPGQTQGIRDSALTVIFTDSGIAVQLGMWYNIVQDLNLGAKMMNTPILSQIEQSINQLSLDEQLWLMEQLAHRIRENTLKQSFWDTQLAAMAADPEIQNELRKIEEEFAFAEADGLEAV